MTGMLGRLWKRPGIRGAAWQALAAAGVIGAALWFAGNLSANLARRSLDLGFGFLSARASFELGENLVGYAAGSSFLHAFAAGLANTVQVALLGILLTGLIGFTVSLMRLSRNPLVARASWLYVEIARNTPLLLQLLFWHQLIVRILPAPKQAWTPVSGVFLSNRGFFLPLLDWQDAFGWALLALAIAVPAAVLLKRRFGALIWLLPPVAAAAALLLLAGPITAEMPALRGFNFRGGATVSPEMAALVWSLVFYQSAFAAETIRGGILGVPKGMIEAAASLGLSRRHVLRFVVVPQALRIVLPPLASQFMSLTKNSSLAVAIGYPDLVRVSTVTITETGRAVECIAIILAVYLSLSLFTAFLMNVWNGRLARQGR